MKRKFFLLTLVLVVPILLAACGTSSVEEAAEEAEEEEAMAEETTEEEATEEEAMEEEATDEEPMEEEEMAEEMTCALITPGPLGDRSFSDSAARGVDRINAELDGMSCVIIETADVSEHDAAMRAAVQQGYDLIMPLAFDAELLFAYAEEFPDQLFASPSDVFAESLPDNLAAFQIDVHESSFLVGLIAGTLTETKIVGAVVGGDAPGLNQFFYGYKQGVLEVCPDCEVLVGYLGFDFNNPSLGLESALAQYEQGADIVYQVAGRSGEGVLEAAAQTGNYAIGVDSNQDFIQPGYVIVSMIKRVDTATYLLAESVVNGTFTGGFSVIGLDNGGAGISWDEGSTTFAEQGPEELTSQLEDLYATVNSYRDQILAGEYEVCDALNPTSACDGIAPSE